MGAIEPKRCPHCVGFLEAVQVLEHDDFAAPSPVLICRRCDGEDTVEEPMSIPLGWE